MEPDLFGIIRKKMELKEINVNDYSPLTLASVSYTHLDVYKRQGYKGRSGRWLQASYKAGN